MAKPPTVFMFSGQGSHYYHMGRELYERHVSFRRHLLELNRLAQSLSGDSIVEILYDERRKKTDTWDHTPHTHPAIFLLEVALARTLGDEGIVPDYVLGASLGMFAAAVVAGCTEAETALAAALKQAKLLHTHCRPGGMIAILDRPEGPTTQACLADGAVIASFNFSSHFVLAAPAECLSSIESRLRGANVSFQRLPVSRAFHSAGMDEAALPYREALRDLALKPAAVPFVCCVRAAIRQTLEPDYFWTAVREPIRFAETIRVLESRQPLRYIDVGPSGTLATFVKYNLSGGQTESEAFSLLTPFGQDMKNLETLKARLG